MADSYWFQFRHQPFDQFITACGVDVVDVGVVSAGNAAEGVRLLKAGQFLQRFQHSLFCGVFAVGRGPEMLVYPEGAVMFEAVVKDQGGRSLMTVLNDSSPRASSQACSLAASLDGNVLVADRCI